MAREPVHAPHPVPDRLRAALIFVEDKTLGRIYLNAGILDQWQGTFASCSSGARSARAADLDMLFIWRCQSSHRIKPYGGALAHPRCRCKYCGLVGLWI